MCSRLLTNSYKFNIYIYIISGCLPLSICNVLYTGYALIVDIIDVSITYMRTLYIYVYIYIYKWHASYPSNLKQTLCFPVCRCSVAVVVGEPRCTIPSTQGFQKSSGWWLMVGGWFGSWSHIGMNISKIWNRQADFVGIPRGYAPTSSIHSNPHFWRLNRVKSHDLMVIHG